MGGMTTRVWGAVQYGRVIGDRLSELVLLNLLAVKGMCYFPGKQRAVCLYFALMNLSEPDGY